MAIVRKDKLLAGYNGNLESVIILKDTTKELKTNESDVGATNGVEVTNGVFVVLEGGFFDGGRETRKARLAIATDSPKDVLFIHNSEVMYDERQHKLKDFRIKAGKVARAYRLFDGDIITLTKDLFSGVPALKDVLLVKATGLIGKPAVAGDVALAKVTFEVIEDAGFELDPEMQAFAVQVVRN